MELIPGQAYSKITFDEAGENNSNLLQLLSDPEYAGLGFDFYDDFGGNTPNTSTRIPGFVIADFDSLSEAERIALMDNDIIVTDFIWINSNQNYHDL